jgi:hypothetical protein
MTPSRKTPQNTAHIARTVVNLALCRTFSRAMLLLVIDRRR